MNRRQLIPTLGLLPLIIKQLIRNPHNTINNLYHNGLHYYCKIYASDDIRDKLPPGWEKALDGCALRIKESIDEEILDTIIRESKHE